MVTRNYPKNRVQNNYSYEEKLGMIQEYLTTDISMNKISRKYRIGYHTMSGWMRTFGIPMPIAVSSVEFMQKNENVKKSKDIKTLETQIKELQEELDREKLKTLSLNTMIDVAEENLKIEIRKKAGVKR
jgi:transposase